MELMGRSSAANHDLLHAAVAGHLGLTPLWRIERLLSGGLDEEHVAYRDIGDVMAAQADLVRIRGTFLPRIVKMAR